jgi:hypothetical protein
MGIFKDIPPIGWPRPTQTSDLSFLRIVKKTDTRLPVEQLFGKVCGPCQIIFVRGSPDG